MDSNSTVILSFTSEASLSLFILNPSVISGPSQFHRWGIIRNIEFYAVCLRGFEGLFIICSSKLKAVFVKCLSLLVRDFLSVVFKCCL